VACALRSLEQAPQCAKLFASFWRGRHVDVAIPISRRLGSQTKVVAAIIRAAVSENPPRRLLLGSDAYGAVTNALEETVNFRAAKGRHVLD
jgi:hypothetical protein